MDNPEDNSSKSLPHGEIVMRTIAMPSDSNGNGDIFGGWLMSQMDIGGAVLARSIARGRVATVAADSMSFVSPVAVGDVVTCYARLVSIGRSSMKIDIDAWVQRFKTNELRRVTEGVFTYVAIDENGRPRPVPDQKQG
ncbi:MAG: acyl-CoA thioester hydrolase YciA [Puniceicoccales bacterium]|nr:acyl-CoA thioester hydrolase YciA [Puniceicoccales bacterium]